MTEFVIGAVDDFPDGCSTAVQAGKRTIAVFRVKDQFYAVNNACPHKGASLCEGEVVAGKLIVRCPWHHWNWKLSDGTLEADSRQALRRYQIFVQQNEVILVA